MRIGRLEIRKCDGRRPPLQVPELTEAELARAFGVSESNPLFCGIRRLIEQFKQQAVEQATDEMNKGNYLGSATFLGGWEHLDTLAKEIDRRREEAMRQSKPARESNE